MPNTRKLSVYTINIYNDHHSCNGVLETDKTGKIVACIDLTTCDGWRDENDGSTDEILNRAIDAANKAIAEGKVPAELPNARGDYLVVASVEFDGNCADIFANYEAEEEAE